MEKEKLVAVDSGGDTADFRRIGRVVVSKEFVLKFMGLDRHDLQRVRINNKGDLEFVLTGKEMPVVEKGQVIPEVQVILQDIRHSLVGCQIWDTDAGTYRFVKDAESEVERVS